MECQACGKETNKLYEISFNNSDIQEVCYQCYCEAESIGDMEYERQKEYNPDNPDNERN